MNAPLKGTATHPYALRGQQGPRATSPLPPDGRAYYEQVMEAAREGLAAWLLKEGHVHEQGTLFIGATGVFINDGIRARNGRWHRLWIMGDTGHGFTAALSSAATNPGTFQDSGAMQRVLGMPHSSEQLLKHLLELAGAYFGDRDA